MAYRSSTTAASPVHRFEYQTNFEGGLDLEGIRRRQREESAQPEAEQVGAYQAEAAALQQRQEEAAHPEAEAAVLQPSRRWP